MAETLTKQELASKIWETANKLRSKIKANEYKDYILGFMFYKFLSDTEEQFLEKNDATKEDIKDADEDTIKMIQDELGYFIASDDLFSSWIEKGINLVTSDVSDALIRFNSQIKNEYKKVYENIFSTLSGGLSKFGENLGTRNKAVRDMVAMTGEIPSTSDEYDVMGYIYEFLIFKFATAAKDDGAFYTPHEVSLLISLICAEACKDKEHIQVYDPTCGSAGLLLTIGDAMSKYVDKDEIEYFGQEKITETYNLSRMNLVMKGCKPAQISIRNGDTLEDDWPYFDENTEYNPVFVDVVVSNPPYSLNWEADGKENDARFRGYGVAPKSKADYAFLLHSLYHLKPTGVMGIVLPHGVLFRGGTEGAIRKQLIENNQIETIIGLPANLFYNTSIPTLIMILRKNRTATYINDKGEEVVDDRILFVDASKEFKSEKKQNILTQENIDKIFKAVQDRTDVDKFAHLATKQEVIDNDYNLNIPRYVDTFEKEEEIDLDDVRNSINKVREDKQSVLNDINKMMAELGLADI
jgi:type I restriction enzyme M protein